MSTIFKVPEQLIIADQTEFFIIIGMNWLDNSPAENSNEEEDDCKFEVDVNDQVVDAQPLNAISGEATESYLV